MKGDCLVIRMRCAGQTEVFGDPKTHISCPTPPLKRATNSVKLLYSGPFICFTFLSYAAKLDLSLIARVITNHLIWIHA